MVPAGAFGARSSTGNGPLQLETRTSRRRRKDSRGAVDSTSLAASCSNRPNRSCRLRIVTSSMIVLLIACSTCAVLAADQQHFITSGVKAEKPNEVSPPARRRVTGGNDSPREKRRKQEEEYKKKQAERKAKSKSDSDAYDHVKEASSGSIYSKADKSLCIAVNDDDDIVVRDCTNYDRREWTTVIVAGKKSDDRTYKFIQWEHNDDKCITVQGDVKEGAKLKMASCNDKEDYLWKFEEGDKWRPKADLGLCVDLSKTKAGIKPTLRDCDDTKLQRWDVGKGKEDDSDSKKSNDKSNKTDDSDSKKSDDSNDSNKSADDNYGDYKNRSINPRLDEDLCVSIEDKDEIALQDCNGKDSQAWTLFAVDADTVHHEDGGRYYMIISKEDSDMCIDVSDARENRRLRLTKCDKKDRHQMWDLDNKGRLHAMDDDNLCSEIPNVRDGTNLRLVKCSSTDRQRWELSKSGQTADSSDDDSDDSDDDHKKTKYDIVTPLLDDDLCVTSDGDDVELMDCKKGKDEQGWSLMTVKDKLGDSNDGDYYVMIVSQDDDGMCIDVTDAKDGRKLILAKCDEDDKHQRWDVDDGRRWRPMDDRSLCVDIQRVREGSSIRLMDCSNTERQRWNYGGGDNDKSKSKSKSKSKDKDDDKKKESKDSSKSSKESSSEEKCSDDDSGDDEHHGLDVHVMFEPASYSDDYYFWYGKGKGGKSDKSDKSSKSQSSKSSKNSKGSPSRPLPRPTYPAPRPKPKPSCKPKPSSPSSPSSPSDSRPSSDYWDHEKVSSKGSIFSLADESLCIAFNDDGDIVMRDCTNKNEREWSLITIAGDSDDGRTYKFITWKKDKDKCITVQGQVREGAELKVAKCDEKEDYLWKFNEGSKWRPKEDLGLCVDLDRVREGTRPTLQDCRDTNRQRWDVGKGKESRPSRPSPTSPSRPGSRPTSRPTQDPETCGADRTCNRPRRPI